MEEEEDILEEAVYVNPRTDFGFKLFFGDKVLLMGFLNSLFDGDPVIKDLRYRDKEILPASADGRRAVYDLFCTTDKNEEIIVEMQRADQTFFKERGLYYIAKSIVAQEKKGKDWDFKLHPVYGVFILDFCIENPVKEALTFNIGLADLDTGEEFGRMARMTFIQLPRFTKKECKCVTLFDRFIYILRHMETMQRIDFAREQELFQRAEERMRVAALNEAERRDYEASLKFWRDYNAQIKFAEIRSEARGEARGIAKEKYATAKRLLDLCATLEYIATACELDIEEVRKLANKEK